MEKERENLTNELNNSHQRITDLRHEMSEMQVEEKRLRHALRDTDATIAKQKKDIESIMNERDVIGAQIVRRNDELSLQYNKIQLLQTTLDIGEKKYNQKLEEIRLLKLELGQLKLSKSALEKNSTNMGDLRGELFNLERQLTMERLKVTALEEEMQNPLNIHRWRNLEVYFTLFYIQKSFTYN